MVFMFFFSLVFKSNSVEYYYSVEATVGYLAKNPRDACVSVSAQAPTRSRLSRVLAANDWSIIRYRVRFYYGNCLMSHEETKQLPLPFQIR